MRYLSTCFIALFSLLTYAQTPCIDGLAGGYPCNNVELLSFLSIENMGGISSTESTDIWGWTDPLTKKEYAILALTNGTSFVDITDPLTPIYLGRLPTATSSSPWRDVKVIKNYAFIVSEAFNHGVQSFDLRELRNLTNIPTTFSALGTYNGIGTSGAHNVVALEESEHIVVVGTNTCSGGLIFIDVSDPANMVETGCFSADGYTHDAVCFVYKGPDTEHIGKEICIASNEDTQTIVDVTDKGNPIQLSRFDFLTFRYSHQSWITDDHKYLLLDDEFDERIFNQNTRTHILDISDLDNPSYIDYYQATTKAIDHNQYVKGQFSYQGNYRAGFRMVDLSDVSNGNLTERAFFDTYKDNDDFFFNGAWSVYPYFESGNILISDIEQGLFVVKPNVPHFVLSSERFPLIAAAGDPISFDFSVTPYYNYTDDVQISVSGSAPGVTYNFDASVSSSSSNSLTVTGTESLAGAYHILIKAAGPSNNAVHEVAVAFLIVPRYYVDPDISSSGSGESWASAFQTLQEAILATPDGGEIWVKAGTYYPTTGTDRNISFELRDGHHIYGGFAGTEVLKSQRNLEDHVSVLSGDIGTIGNLSDNSHHVIGTSGVTSSIVIDGFTISDGNANAIGHTEGGGLLNENRFTQIRNCTFVNNFASRGSAIFNRGLEIELIDCEIIGLDAEMMVSEPSIVAMKNKVNFKKN